MRAVDIVLPSAGTFTLNFPQDGVTQPASFVRTASIRKARSSVTVLVKPNQNDPLASVNSVNFVDPTTITDSSGVETVGAPIRASFEVRVPSVATESQIAAFKLAVTELLSDNQILAALFTSERLI